MTVLDRRITPARADLAAQSLQGKVEAARFVAGEAARVIAPSAAVRRLPDMAGALDTEALAGELVTVYDRAHGFAWVQLAGDGYVGYVREDQLGAALPAPTHKINVLRSFAYPTASMKLPALAHYSFGAHVKVVAETGEFAELATGSFIWRTHLVPLDHLAPDPVEVADLFLHTPYLWGGKTSLGLDCSSLTQLALAACGITAPRDSDMQEAALGTAVPITADFSGLARGDLVFWKGHVGLMQDSGRLLHASGYQMLVVSEALPVAARRILASGAGAVTSIRRLG